MQKDRQFRVAGEWALASDDVQWMLQIKRGNSWRPIKYIRSTKAHLADRMREKGVPPEDMRTLLDGLPDTFDEWLAAKHGRSEASHDDFEREGAIPAQGNGEMHHGTARREAEASPCRDCGMDTTPYDEHGEPIPGTWEWYGVRADVWRTARMKPNGGYLCIECLEQRLHRKLTAADFKTLNTTDLDTPRLLNRLNSRCC